ncbi:MAG: three-Cys-motif partner protein TcmP, partial [Nostoc sp.]
LLTRDGNIKESLKKRLDETFGTTDWFDSFYTTTGQLSLFENSPQRGKTVDCEAIGRYFVKRLKTVFPGVAENPLVLRNSRNSPLYLLCFASANPKGSKTAIKIAQHILKA